MNIRGIRNEVGATRTAEGDFVSITTAPDERASRRVLMKIRTGDGVELTMPLDETTARDVSALLGDAVRRFTKPSGLRASGSAGR